jgi:hypothetical protein
MSQHNPRRVATVAGTSGLFSKARNSACSSTVNFTT